MNGKTKSIIVSIFVVVLFFLVYLFWSPYYHGNIGGVNKLYLPFPVKVTSCGTSYDSYTNCTYPLIWWGILVSILFWIVVVALIYKIARNIIKDK